MKLGHDFTCDLCCRLANKQKTSTEQICTNLGHDVTKAVYAVLRGLMFMSDKRDEVTDDV